MFFIKRSPNKGIKFDLYIDDARLQSNTLCTLLPVLSISFMSEKPSLQQGSHASSFTSSSSLLYLFRFCFILIF